MVIPEAAWGDSGWQAEIDLAFSRRGARTALLRSAHRGPLRVQRPFYPEANGACHVYLLHPPGGIVGGDVMRVQADVEGDAHALLTTPGAGKWYRSAGATARISQQARVAAGGCLELMPQENIAYAGSRVQMTTSVHLADDSARFVGWDVLCLGRPACGERFEAGDIEQRFALYSGNALRFWERAHFVGGSALLRATWGLRQQPVVGTFVCAPAERAWIDAVREAIGPREDFAVTWVHGLAIARYLGNATRVARSLFERSWRVLRPLYAGAPVTIPRVWNT